MSTGFTNVIDAIEKTIFRKEIEISELKKALVKFKSFNDRGSETLSHVSSDQFKNKSVGVCIREYVAENGPTSKDELWHALEAGGCALGKYPKRTVATAIGNLHHRLELGDDGLIHSK
jgi:hypothetical protein